MPRALLPVLLLASVPALAQPKAQPCFFSADFADGTIPDGWDIGPEVEMQDPQGNGLGTFTPAWTVGDADDANANGYFPVPDTPFGNRFLMANDDAAPCNCDLADVAVTTPPIDLTGRARVVLEARVVHAQELGAGPATVEVRTGAGPWTVLHTIPAVPDEWQPLAVDLAAYDGEADVRLRFRWSDGGGWAGGFAVDDICLRERLERDLTVVSVHPNDITASPFATGDQGLRYHKLPLEQAAPVTVSAVVRNSGTDTLFAIGTAATITLNGDTHGPFTGAAIDTLVPGGQRTVTIATGWTADATGALTVAFTATADGDEDPADNSGQAAQTITGPGWDDHYGAMAADAGTSEGLIGGAEPFMALNRFELVHAGSTPHGLTAHLAGGTLAGAVVRAVLMDAQFTVVDTSARHTITPEEETAFWWGEPLYLPFTLGEALPPGDFHAGIQMLDDTTDAPVLVAVSGAVPVGASVLLDGPSFLVRYLHAAPMVRLHLWPVAVGIHEAAAAHGPDLLVLPVPMAAEGVLRFTLDRAELVTWQVLDIQGRPVVPPSARTLPAGDQALAIQVGHLPTGLYIAEVRTGDQARRRLFTVAR
ncbi:MAG: hypothetical protein RBT71_06645 [Flavobacteriales bacterium]|jgi:hypothetical protein|nr:hypothetical protein [Flavobacteriales bacterium]